MQSELFTFTTRAVDSVMELYRQHPRSFILGPVAAIAAPWLVQNYRAFLKLGKSSIVLWIAALLIKPATRETTSVEEYDRDSNKESWLRADGDLTRRDTSRPRTGWHPLPHRQVEQLAERPLLTTLENRFKAIAAANTDLVEVTLSPHEGTFDAMIIHSSLPTPHPVAKHAMREITHIHNDIDGSLHVVLSPQDCKAVIQQGWGERHPISGRVLLPKEWLLIYAPRTEKDLHVIERIIKASVGYMTNNHGVQ